MWRVGLAALILGCGACYRPPPLPSLPPTASALSEPPETGAPLDDDGAVRLALARSGHLKAMELQTLSRKARAEAAAAWSNPELRSSQRHFEEGTTERWFDWELEARWRPPAPGERAARADEAVGRAAQDEADWRTARLDLAVAVRALALRQRFLAATEPLLSKRQELLEDKIDLLDAQLDTGQADAVALAEARLALSEVEFEARAQRRERRRVARALSVLLGTEVTPSPGRRTQGMALRPLESLVEEALKRRPELLSTSAGAKRAEARLHLERWRQIPWFSFVGVGWRVGLGSDPHGVETQFGVEIPLLDWNTDNVRAAELSIDRAATEARAVREDIAAEVERAQAELRAAETRHVDTRAALEEITAEINRTLAQAEKHQTATPVERLDLRLRLSRLQARLPESALALGMADLALMRALGIEAP